MLLSEQEQQTSKKRTRGADKSPRKPRTKVSEETGEKRDVQVQGRVSQTVADHIHGSGLVTGEWIERAARREINEPQKEPDSEEGG